LPSNLPPVGCVDVAVRITVWASTVPECKHAVNNPARTARSRTEHQVRPSAVRPAAPINHQLTRRRGK
jgi:hypothetical protein